MIGETDKEWCQHQPVLALLYPLAHEPEEKAEFQRTQLDEDFMAGTFVS